MTFISHCNRQLSRTLINIRYTDVTLSSWSGAALLHVFPLKSVCGNRLVSVGVGFSLVGRSVGRLVDMLESDDETISVDLFSAWVFNPIPTSTPQLLYHVLLLMKKKCRFLLQLICLKSNI